VSRRAPPKPDDDERELRHHDPHDTVELKDKKSGRGRPPPRRGLEFIVEKEAERLPALVVGALPAHVEVLLSPDTAPASVRREDVQVVRVHPALVAALQSPLVVGDRITVARLQSGTLFAVDAEPRTTMLARPAVEREKQAQPIVANAGVLWVVVAVESPPLRPGLVDRFFVAASAGGLSFRLLATKMDLGGDEESRRWLAFYEGIGVPVTRTSIMTGEGLDTVREGLRDEFSVFVGQSGVGKSSVVRAILPEQPIAVGEMSVATGKGKHTTTVTRYYRLPEGGAVVDTPGLRELGLWGADRSHLALAFPDLSALAEGCRFDDCKHASEPGCRVTGDPSVAPERLASWRKLSDEIDERLKPGFGKPGGPTGRG
jgi:ribosome biogenesis GTPase